MEIVETGVVEARLSIDPNIFVNATVVAFGAALADPLSPENLAFRLGVASMLNEKLGGALKVFEEPLIEVGIESPAVPVVVELDCPEQRQFVKHRGVDERV